MKLKLAVTVDGQLFSWGDGLYNYLAILYIHLYITLAVTVD